MRNRLADGFESSVRSQACLASAHEDCPHQCGFGGGLNPRRLRFESGVVLCKCACHSGCPVAGSRVAVPEVRWQESCTCPDADDMRGRMDRVPVRDDSSEYAVPAPHQSPARREAFDAMRPVTAGRSREQVKDLYTAELLARRLEVPPEILLNAEVMLLTGDYPRDAGIASRALAGLVKLLGGMNRPSR